MLKLRQRQVLFATLTALALGACGEQEEKKAGLIVAVQTDMAVPKDVDEIRITIRVDGQLKFQLPQKIGEGELQLPATLTLLPPEDASRPVTIEVVSFQSGKARTLRKVVTTVPNNREALLRMPIQWLSDGMVEEDTDADAGAAGAPGEDATPQRFAPGERVVLDLGKRPQAEGIDSRDWDYRSTCPMVDKQGKRTHSAVNGTCVPDKLDSTKLPDYTDAEVFGGKNADTVGACFPTLTCFEELQVITPTLVDGDCTVEGLDAKKLNFAVTTGTSRSGICGSDEEAPCLVPLDYDEDAGWSVDGDDVVHLPPFICEKLEDADYTLIASNECESKIAKTPTCGPWSVVEGEDEGEIRPIAMPSGGTTGSGGGSATGGTTAAGGAVGAGGAISGGGTVGAGGTSTNNYDHIALMAADGLVQAAPPTNIGGFFVAETDGTSSGTLNAPATGFPSVSGLMDPMVGSYSTLLFSTSMDDISNLAGFAYTATGGYPLVFGVVIDDLTYCAPATSEPNVIVPFANLIECVTTGLTRPPSTGALHSVFWKLEQDGNADVGDYNFGLQSLDALWLKQQ